MEANDNKAMREALSDAHFAILNFFKAKHVCYEHGSLLKTAMDKAKSALAAPPRNCDMLSAEQCKQIFNSEMEVYLSQEATDNDREIARRTAYGVIDTLFAPYTEQKGETDGG